MPLGSCENSHHPLTIDKTLFYSLQSFWLFQSMHFNPEVNQDDMIYILLEDDESFRNFIRAFYVGRYVKI